MSVPSSSLFIYQTGGSLPSDAPTYVKREADTKLYDWLKEGQFCYVLNARQMGKSSLRIQIMTQLQREGVACSAVDLTEIGSSDVTRDEWYAGVIDSLVKSLNLDENFDLEVWWNNQKLLSASQKLSKFLSEVLLLKIGSPIVIFIDEIDSTLKLNFKDDFFALIRACYNQRADNPEYKRLTFCLLGVASPSNLIADPQSTPFNIGKGIDLEGFRPEEIEPLTKYLPKNLNNPSEIMREILLCTGGQPFLTQRLCQLVVTENQPTPNVSHIVQRNLIDNWEAQDEQAHLRTIKDRILSNEQRVGYLLELYRKVLIKEKVPINNSSEERELQLSGLVVKKGNTLQVYNPIYAKVFNENWIDAELAKLRPYAGKFELWQESPEQQKEFYLLYGRELDNVLAWKAEKYLSQPDNNYLTKSEIFWSETQFKLRQYKKEKCEIIIKYLLNYTGGLKIFNEIFFNISEMINLKVGQEKQWIENSLKTELSKKIQNNSDKELCRYLGAIENIILNNNSVDSFWLIFIYEYFFELPEALVGTGDLLKILKVNNLDIKNEVKELIKLGLIIKKEKKLMKINEVFKYLFNRTWINDCLKKSRPYALNLFDWLKTNYEDNSYLLKENDLEQAMNWIYKKNLKEPEMNFIISSLVEEVWQSKGDSEIEKKKNSAVDIVNKSIAKLQEKTDDIYSFIKVTLKWTKADPFLFDSLLELLVNSQDDLTTYGKIEQAENLVRLQIDKNWKNSVLEEQCKSIETQLINDKSFWLLVTYRQILLGKTINFSSKQEKQRLRIFKLVITNKNNQLEVANEVYKNYFNSDWVLEKLSEKNIINLENLLAWLDSEQFINHISILKNKFPSDFKPIIQQIVLWTHQENKFIVTIDKIVKFIESQTIELENEQWFKENIIFSPKLCELLDDQEFKIFIKNLISINLPNLKNESYDLIYQSLEKLITNHINSLMIAETIISITQGKTKQIGKIVDRICQDNSLITSQDSIITVKEKIKKINDDINLVCAKIDLAKIKQNPMETPKETPKLTLEERKALNLDELLDYIVNRAKDIEAIFLVKLSNKETAIEYWNRELQSSNPELYQKLIGRTGRSSDLLNYFECLKSIPKNFNSFGNQIKINKREGELNCLILNFPEKLDDKEKEAYKRESKPLTERQLIVSFTEIKGTNYGICYLSKDNIPVSRFLGRVEISFDEIEDKLKEEVDFM